MKEKHMNRLINAVLIPAWIVAVILSASCKEKSEGRGLPQKLPFSITRPDQGQPLSEGEVAAFTLTVTGFWKNTDFFRWIIRTSHGWQDGPNGMPDYLINWGGGGEFDAVKQTDTVTFRHLSTGGPDNIMIPSSKILASASSGYLLTGDEAMGKLVEQYCKGTSATMMGMVWDANDPVRTIMARAVLNNNHEYLNYEGKKTKVDYTLARQPSVDWNTHTIHIPNNPYWGDIWVKNMRSKDDVPHIYRADFFLHYVAQYAKEYWVREAAQKTLSDLKGFTQDIVENNYHIRSRNEAGEVFTPTEDLASFVDYEVIAKNAECNAKLTSALIGYDNAKGNDCESGSGGVYDDYSCQVHYYNRAIIRGFHMDAVLHSLRVGNNDAAYELLEGLIARIDKEEALPDDKLQTDRENWNGDFAVFLIQAAATGVPLTSDEARLIHKYYGQTISAMQTWNRWDLWNSSIPDGTYNYRPDYLAGTYIDSSELGLILEYCYSPLKNPAGVRFVDCDVVSDMNKW